MAPVNPVKTKINNKEECGNKNPNSEPVKTLLLKIFISP